MEAIVAINPKFKNSFEYENLGTVCFGNVNIPFGLIELKKPNFDKNATKNKDYVLIKVTAFSCNFRDKGILLSNYENITSKDQVYVPFGSEFSGVVVKKGTNVSNFSLNQRVMSDCSYPRENSTIHPGIVTNFASLGWLRIHKDKLVAIPKELSDSEAACFSLGSQTAHSMVRRSGVLEKEDSTALVFSSKSATSLFIIKHLLAHGKKPIALSTSTWSKWEKEQVNNIEILKMSDFDKSKDFFNVSHVFDPFFDLNIYEAVSQMTTFGTYITCGINNQHPKLSQEKTSRADSNARVALTIGILKNISFLGNCLGTKNDLTSSINMIEKGINVKPIIDQEFDRKDGIHFIEKTFFEGNKFGKCVMIY